MGALAHLSGELAALVERVGPSVVRVDDGSRLTATGLIWSADGFILTTSHGTERDDGLFVEMADGARHAATVVGRDDDTDIALLRVEAQNLSPITPSPEGDAQVGHLVLALGRPGTGGLQATLGILSARLEAQSDGQPEFILHTDANLYPGFSGGPLVNMAGQVVGMANLALGRGQGVALGVSILTHVAQNLQQGGGRSRGYLGISTQPVTLGVAAQSAAGGTQEHALLIVQVQDGSPAASGGLLLGDILLGIDDVTVDDPDALRRRLHSLAAGQSVALKLLRAGQPQTVTATLGAQEQANEKHEYHGRHGRHGGGGRGPVGGPSAPQRRGGRGR